MTWIKRNIDIVFISVTLSLLVLFVFIDAWRFVDLFFVMLLFGSIIFMLPIKGAENDERLIKLKSRAGFYTFLFTLTLLTIALIYQTFFPFIIRIRSIGTYDILRYLLMIILTFYSISYIVLRRKY